MNAMWENFELTSLKYTVSNNTTPCSISVNVKTPTDLYEHMPLSLTEAAKLKLKCPELLFISFKMKCFTALLPQHLHNHYIFILFFLNVILFICSGTSLKQLSSCPHVRYRSYKQTFCFQPVFISSLIWKLIWKKKSSLWSYELKFLCPEMLTLETPSGNSVPVHVLSVTTETMRS